MMCQLDSISPIPSAFLVAILVAGVVGCSPVTPSDLRYRPGRFEFDWPPHATLEPRSRRSANERLSIDTELLIVKLQDVAVTSAVQRANARTPASLDTVMRIEEAWRTADVGDPTVSARVDDACSESLKLLSAQTKDFEEILVTDSRGLVVCQTRKTDRFFQGEQAWWRECVEGGRLSHSRLDYDAASETIALSIFAPVLDPSTGQSIGVARALLRRHVGTRERSGR
jgi:hypothetical protein